MVNDYFEIYAPDHHRAKQNGCVDIHILEAEKLIGRPLKDQEVVHHKDLNKHNNSPDNLLVFVDQANHTRFHHTGKYAETNEAYVVYAPKQYMDKCILCGKALKQENKHNQCWECWTLSRRKVQRPDAETLKQLVEQHTIVDVGRMYGVSDNAIRKWCKIYGINCAKRKSSIGV